MLLYEWYKMVLKLQNNFIYHNYLFVFEKCVKVPKL